MDTSLPMYVDPARLASRRETLTGSLDAHKLTRLGGYYRCTKPVAVELNFASGRFGRIKVGGCLMAELEAQCQRCLQPVVVSIEQQLDLQLVDIASAAGAEQAPQEGANDGEFDDAVEYESKLNVYELVEDELVLACPIVPSHPADQCGGEDADAPLTTEQSSAASTGATERAETRKPFAGLADLLAQTPEPNGKSD